MSDLNKIENLTESKKRNLYAGFITELLDGFGSGGFFLVLQPLLLRITSSLFATGLIVTIASLVQVGSMPLIGRLADRFGRKRVWLIGNPVIIFGGLILIVANDTLFAGIAVVFIYLGGIMCGTSLQMIVSESSSESKKGSNFSFMSFAGSGARICSNIFVMLDIGDSFRLYVWLFIAMKLLVWLAVLFIVIPTLSELEKKEETITEDLNPEKKLWSELFRTPKIKIIVTFFSLNWFFEGIVLSIWYAWMVDIYGVTQQELALIVLVLNVFYLIFHIPAGRIIDKIGNKKALLIGEILNLISTFIAILVFFMWSNGFSSAIIPGTVIAVILYTPYYTIIIPVEQIYLTNLTENRKAESFGTVRLITEGGSIPTGVIGGFLVDFVHPIAPSIINFGGIIFLICFLIKYFDNWNQERGEENVSQ